MCNKLVEIVEKKIRQKEEKQKLETIKSILIAEFEFQKAKHKNRELKSNDFIEIEMELAVIPEELRNLFLDKIPVLWGEFSGYIGKEKKFFYVQRSLQVKGNKIYATLLKNW